VDFLTNQMKTAYIADLAPDQNVTAFFLVCDKEIRTGNSGKPYLRLSLGDRTGVMEARMWENFERDAASIARDDFAKVQGRVDLFNGRKQLRVDKIRRAEPGEIELDDYFPHTKENVDVLEAQLREYSAAIGNPWLRQLVANILEEPAVMPRLRRAPAARSMHHAFIGGLLEHIVSLCGLCQGVGSRYAEVDVDWLLTAAVLHDIGKLDELTYERAFSYSDEGQLLGHIIIGLELVTRHMEAMEGFPAEMKTLVKHLIISHHSKLEFGSPKLPAFREAVLFGFLDDIDAKMASMRTALEDAGGEGQWTAYNGALARKLLRVEQFLNPAPAKSKAAAPAGQLSLGVSGKE